MNDYKDENFLEENNIYFNLRLIYHKKILKIT